MRNGASRCVTSPLWGVEHMFRLLFPPLNTHRFEWETPCVWVAFGRSGILVLLTDTAPALQGKLMGEGGRSCRGNSEGG